MSELSKRRASSTGTLFYFMLAKTEYTEVNGKWFFTISKEGTSPWNEGPFDSIEEIHLLIG